MKNLKTLPSRTLCAFIIITALISCYREPIDLKLNSQENQKVVISAWLNTLPETQKVNVSLTSDYLEIYTPNYISDAAVTLKYDGTEIALTYLSNGDYFLPNNWKAEEFKVYSLEVNHEGTTYSATSTLKPIPEIKNIHQREVEDPDEIDIKEGMPIPEAWYHVYFEFQETPGEGDGYYGIDYIKGSGDGDTLANGGFINDDFFDGIYLSDLSIESTLYVPGDTVILELHSVGKPATDYLEDILTEIYREGVFDPTPVNVRSNFTNGALGYFITSGASRHEIIIE